MRGVLILITVSFICILIHLVLARLRLIKVQRELPIKKLIYQWKLLLGIWIGILSVVSILYILYASNTLYFHVGESGIVFNFIYGIVFFGMLFFLYLTVYYVVDRSVSSRIMIEIESSQLKRLKFEDLRRIYDVDAKYLSELKGMLQGGFVRVLRGSYSNTIKGAIVAKIAGTYKKLFMLGKGG